MPKLTEEHFEARKAQILEGAFRCLARKGYSRMTVRDIAAEAGVSVGTIYLYFRGKEEIVAALAAEYRSRTDAELDAEVPAGEPLEILGSVLEYFLAAYDDPTAADVFRVDVQIWAAGVHEPALRELYLNSHEYGARRFAELIAAAQEANELPRELAPDAVGRLLMTMLAGLELHKVMEPGRELRGLGESFDVLIEWMRSARASG
jgi:AcrR family transcriptional regulator